MLTSGLLTEERIGRTRQVRPNDDSRLAAPVRRLLALTHGALPTLERELSGSSGVREAFVYGSWAARHEGIEGQEPNDVDGLAVGDPDLDELFARAGRAESRLGREVPQ